MMGLCVFGAGGGRGAGLQIQQLCQKGQTQHWGSLLLYSVFPVPQNVVGPSKSKVSKTCDLQNLHSRFQA